LPVESLTARPPDGAGPVNETVAVELAPPIKLAGESATDFSDAATTLNDAAADPPPGVGFETVTVTVPGLITYDAGTVAEIDVALTAVICSALVPIETVVADTNPLPEIVSVKLPAPATTDDGAAPVTVGNG